MEFVDLFNLPLNANSTAVGEGDRYFVDALLEKGYQHIYVLDVSAKLWKEQNKGWEKRLLKSIRPSQT